VRSAWFAPTATRPGLPRRWPVLPLPASTASTVLPRPSPARRPGQRWPVRILNKLRSQRGLLGRAAERARHNRRHNCEPDSQRDRTEIRDHDHCAISQKLTNKQLRTDPATEYAEPLEISDAKTAGHQCQFSPSSPELPGEDREACSAAAGGQTQQSQVSGRFEARRSGPRHTRP
jgi:hypothetical protein